MVAFGDRVALVTGASGGLGGAVTAAFLETGATVAGVARSAAHRDDEQRFLAVSADLTTVAGATAAVEETLGRAGRLDILVHCMGGFAMSGPVDESDEESWDHMMTLNLRAAFLTTRAALGPMLKAGYGRIVAVGSRASMEPAAGLSAYGASKAGLNALIQTIAMEVADKGITANVVLPSVIDTPDNRKAMPKADFASWVQPEAIARLILHLCAEEAGDVNGALIPIYGRA